MAWGYMGTMAAMVLVIGVLGMGIFHACTQSALGPEYRCFSGLINCASSQPPVGVGEIAGHGLGPYLRFEYDPATQRLTRLDYIDAEGRRSAIPGSKVAEQRMEYDAHGRLVSKRNYSATGEAVEDASGIFARCYSYDADGRLIRTTLLNAREEKVVPLMPGYAEERITYDDQGRPLLIQYLDGYGKPVVNAAGESEIIYHYDDKRHEVVRTNTVNGNTVENHAGFAIERRSSTADGRSEFVSWHDRTGAPVYNVRHGGEAVLCEHFGGEHVQRDRICTPDGGAAQPGRFCTEHLQRTNDAGLLEWECYNAADGLPCDNPGTGYAEHVCEYDEDGNLSCEYFWDGAGHPCPCYEKRYTTTPDGRRHVLTLHTDGSTSVMPAGK